MFIEVTHDAAGNIDNRGCWAANTLPEGGGAAPLALIAQLPEGLSQARINIDTLTAMEIDQNCGQKARIVNGEAKIVFVSYAEYISQNYRVDVSQEVPVPAGVKIPVGMKMRGLVKKV